MQVEYMRTTSSDTLKGKKRVIPDTNDSRSETTRPRKLNKTNATHNTRNDSGRRHHGKAVLPHAISSEATLHRISILDNPSVKGFQYTNAQSIASIDVAE
jgi:hypothetical protein